MGAWILDTGPPRNSPPCSSNHNFLHITYSLVDIYVKFPNTFKSTFMHAKSLQSQLEMNMRAWQPTSVFLPGGSHRQRSLAGYSKHSHEELDATEATYTHSTVELIKIHTHAQGFSCSSVSKESACSEGHPGSIPGLGGSPGEGNGDPLQYPCLENLMDTGAWWAAVHD